MASLKGGTNVHIIIVFQPHKQIKGYKIIYARRLHVGNIYATIVLIFLKTNIISRRKTPCHMNILILRKR